jgi:hypothetical protein
LPSATIKLFAIRVSRGHLMDKISNSTLVLGLE